MRRDRPMTPDETRAILRPLEEAPTPEGMASRALERWVAEASRAEGRIPWRSWLAWPRSYRILRPAVLGIAAILTVFIVVRNRIGLPPSGLTDETVRASKVGQQPVMSKPSEYIGGAARNGADLHRQRFAESVPATTRAAVPHAVPALPERKSHASSSPAATPNPAPPRMATAPASPSTPPGALSRAPQSEGAAVKSDAVPGRLARRSGDTGEELIADRALPSASDLAYLNGAAVAAPDTKASTEHFADSRLAARLTLEEDSISVADLAGVLRSRTGVDISLPDDAARRSLAIYCSDKPLGELLRQMARVLMVRWELSRTDPGAPHYVAIARSTGRSDSSPDGAAEKARTPAVGGFEGAALMRPPRLSVIARERGISMMGEPTALTRQLNNVGQTELKLTEGWLLSSGP